VDPSSEVQLVRDDLFERTITVMVLLWCGVEYLWAAYEVFPAFVMHESGVEDGQYAIWGVIFTMLLQLANMAFMAQALGTPITSIKYYNDPAFAQTDNLARAQNTVGAHLFLILVTEIGFVLLLVIEGIIISNRKYWLDQNPPAEPVVYYEPYYVEKPVYVQVPGNPMMLNRPPMQVLPQQQMSAQQIQQIQQAQQAQLLQQQQRQQQAQAIVQAQAQANANAQALAQAVAQQQAQAAPAAK